ncbi:MAG: ATP-binding protein [bacterium]
MADEKLDLWGDLEPLVTGDNPVRALLEAQARLLEEKTRGLIVGWVESFASADGQQHYELRAASKAHPGEALLLVEALQEPGRTDAVLLVHTEANQEAKWITRHTQSSFVRALAAELQGADTRQLLEDLLDHARTAAEVAARGASPTGVPSAEPPLEVDALIIRSWRSIGTLDFEIGPRTVLFGPNGAGKSSLLDAFALLGDLARRGTSSAVSTRGGGWELLHDRAEEPSFELGVVTNAARYSVTLAVREGRVEPIPGESLRLAPDDIVFFSRSPGERFFARQITF